MEQPRDAPRVARPRKVGHEYISRNGVGCTVKAVQGECAERQSRSFQKMAAGKRMKHKRTSGRYVHCFDGMMGSHQEKMAYDGRWALRASLNPRLKVLLAGGYAAR